MNKRNTNSTYRGRFAPTPSGPLHFGSIITALGSYLQAKSNQGIWLVRIDDIDQARAVTNVDKLILEQLEKLGLHWDEDVIYQSQRLDFYQDALEELQKSNLIYSCSCSRKELSNKPYPGTCRNSINSNNKRHSLRVKTDNNKIVINDQLQGNFNQCLRDDVGDFIINRADGFFAYHLASVVDDAKQNITDIVRGIDLLDSTPRQVYLQQKLNFPIPSYLHLPIAIDSEGKKISKSIKSKSTSLNNHSDTLFNALCFLGQKPPKELKSDNARSILDWAVKNWKVNLLPKQTEIVIN